MNSIKRRSSMSEKTKGKSQTTLLNRRHSLLADNVETALKARDVIANKVILLFVIVFQKRRV